MNISKLLEELRRRNVFKVATAYAIAGWVIIQITDTVFPRLGLPDWTITFIIALIGIGFPIALIVAWAFELTPDGVQKSEDVDITASVTASTGKKLNGIIIGSLCLLVVVLVIERFFIADIATEKAPSSRVENVSSKSVAVLPFEDLSQNGDQEWFSDGLTEEILNSLAQLPELKVTSRTSSFQFKGQDQNIPEIAEKLKVAHVVEGSVRRIGDDIRITAQLIRTSDDFHLWSDTYDSNTDNLFTLQTTIAEDIANKLDVFLDDDRREAMFTAGTRNVEAFEAFLKGRDIYEEVHEAADINSLSLANDYFERAMAIDPEFGEPALYHMDFYAHILTDGTEKERGITRKEAQKLIMSDLEYASNFVDDPILKKAAAANAAFFSDSWYQLPKLVDEIRFLYDGAEMFPSGSVWATNILILMGEHEMMDRISRESIKLNPLSLLSWINRMQYFLLIEDIDGLKNTFEQTQINLGNNFHVSSTIAYYQIFAGEKENIDSTFIKELPVAEAIQPAFLNIVSFIAASVGEIELAEKLLSNTGDSPLDLTDDESFILTLYKIGNTEEARALTRKIDARPAGPASLALTLTLNGNLLYFQLEDAPNFVKRMKEAGVDPNEFKKMDWVN